MPMINDPHLRVEPFRVTPNPQQLCWIAMHQCYAENAVIDELEKVPNEERSGQLIVKHLLSGNRGHFGIFEHPQITFNVIGYSHAVMQQLRTHRVGVSFAVQSGRFTGRRFIDVTTSKCDLEEAFYLRPVGHYTDRNGKHYTYTAEQRADDLDWCKLSCERYTKRISEGLSEEHARGLIPFDFRQHFVVSMNARSLMHVLDLRAKADAQLEIQDLCHRLWPHFQTWMPRVADWYETNRLGKARLSP